MKAKILDADALAAITPTALVAYARAQGWRRKEPYGASSDVYQGEGLPELVIPRTEQLSDYVSVVSLLIGLMARAQERDEIALYRDLSFADRDVIRVRAPGASDDGSLPLEDGVKLVADARNMLLAAACSATGAQSVFRAGGNKEANSYLERVQLGQTEQGSFVVTLLAPVPPALNLEQTSLWPEYNEESFDRMVTRKLVEGLEYARSAIAETRIGDGAIAFESAVEHGVSANLCEAISRLIETGSGVDISVTWAQTRPAPETRRVVRFSPGDAEILVEAAKGYRQRAPKSDVELLGYVHLLKREQTKVEGLVTLRAEVDGIRQSVQAILDERQYSIAVSAHDAKVPIIMKGDLARFGQRWRLSNISRVRKIEDDGGDEE